VSSPNIYAIITARMLNSVDINGRSYKLRSQNAIDISIPLKFNGLQPNAYGVDAATSVPCSTDDLVGDTRQGGSCNFEQYTLIPHCNGTHTECVGHITDERISVRDCLQDVFIPALLITIAPAYASETDEMYSMPIDAADRLITRRRLEAVNSLGSPPARGGVAGFSSPPGLRRGADASSAGWSADGVVGESSDIALIIRTLPNDERKLTRKYLEEVPAYLTTEALNYIVESGFKHLLIDLPSIDRLYDEGRLSNHRIFWNVEQDAFATNAGTRRNSTITELIYVPNDTEDGEYLLNLQIAPFAADASPSRPLLFGIVEN
jgi:arylformamidase